ncbi:hypothetical protein Vqi01_55700 [Micromonospora qiuiae]|uniref:Uncharacterized protein n=1 Tax=Micromonospora qiuiae TaxID=502268 RepID=A0ABQ4JIG7_9ACTN|nr:hypothetical protein Vqi01_55700 [Micromonospora qiuiae]
MPEGEPVETVDGGQADGGVQHGGAGALTPGEPAVDGHGGNSTKEDRPVVFIFRVMVVTAPDMKRPATDGRWRDVAGLGRARLGRWPCCAAVPQATMVSRAISTISLKVCSRS